MVGTLAKVSSDRAAADYYIQSQASHRPAGEYYLAGEEPDGLWWNPHGLFGLEDGRRVDANTFYRLHQGYAPFNPNDPNDLGEPVKLTRNAGSENRVAAFDLTFSPDKSVSTLWAMTHGEDDRLHRELARAHDDAVRTALDLIVDKHCAWTRRRGEDGTLEATRARIMAATFQHQSSRENEPQLHTHCVIFNAALSDDGRWRSLHARPLYEWRRTAGSIYRLALAWNITQRLGLAVERHGRDNAFFRIRGVPQDLQDHWSSRRKQIVGAAKAQGFATADNRIAAQRINKLTRPGKDKSLDPVGRHLFWAFDRTRFVEDVQAILNDIPPHIVTEEDRAEVRKLLDEIPRNLTENEAVWHMTELMQQIAHIMPGMLAPEQIEAMASQTLERTDVLELDRWGEGPDVKADMARTRVFTTRAHLERERDIGRLGQSLAVRPAEAIPGEITDKHLEDMTEKGTPLSAEQEHAVRIATTGQRNVIIEGAAGSGKTTTLTPIANIARDAGWTVYGTAQAWRNAKELAAAAHIPAWCVMTLLNKYRRRQLELDDKSLIIVDEAGQLQVEHAAQLLEIADRTGASIVWSGDTRQQQPIGAGPGLRLLRNEIGSVLVTQIRRQRADAEDILVHLEGITPAEARERLAAMSHTEREDIVRQYHANADALRFVPWQISASSNLRDGFVDDKEKAKKSVGDAIAAYRERDRLHLGAHLEETLQKLVEDWDRHRRETPGRSTLVIARTHDEIGALSPSLRQLALTEEQRAEEVTITVAGDNSETRHRNPRKILVAPGERLVIRTPCRDLGLDTGNLVTVEKIETLKDSSEQPIRNRHGQIRHVITARRDDGKQFTFDPDQIRDWNPEQGLHGLPRLDYGYALTFSAAQGATVDHAYVLADDRPALETIYPSLTRHRDRLDVYVNSEPIRLTVAENRPEYEHQRDVTDEDVLDHLATLWSRSDPKKAARDYILPPDERAAALAPLPPSKPGTTGRREPKGYYKRLVRPRPPGGLSAANWLRGNRSPDLETPFLDELIRAVEQDIVDRNHSESYEELSETIEAIGKNYRAITEREDTTEKVLRSPTYLETLRTHRSLLDRARQALRRIVKRHQHRKTADRAGITRESLVDWIHDYAKRQREFNVAAATSSQSEQLKALEADWRAVTDTAREHGLLPLHAPGWRAAVDRISEAVQKRTIPETSQRTLNSILEGQQTAYRYDRQARDFIQLIGKTHEDAKALFAATQGPHDPAIDWTGIRERKDALQKVVDQLPPADEFAPYLTHYDARANSGLGDTMLARLDRNLRAAIHHQIEVPAASLIRIATDTTRLREPLRQTMREGRLPALYDNEDLDRLRDVAAALGQAVSEGSAAFDSELERHGTNFVTIEALAADTLAAIKMIDQRLDEHTAGAARELAHLLNEARRFRDTPTPDNPVRAARLTVDFEESLSALERRLHTLPPEARIDAALSDIDAGLSLSSLRTELRSLQAHLRVSELTLPIFGKASPSERLVDSLRQARESAASLRRDRQATEKTADTGHNPAVDRKEAEKKTEEEDRSVSREEDTGISIL
ncbi:MAG: relaxase domain-containing protein [Alphaproteobacteria bacterium]|nr:relaxase domain-containing protein [Alphaproteobacteria bacterium]